VIINPGDPRHQKKRNSGALLVQWNRGILFDLARVFGCAQRRADAGVTEFSRSSKYRRSQYSMPAAAWPSAFPQSFVSLVARAAVAMRSAFGVSRLRRVSKGCERPLIVDQPEENLDPKSIFDELVGRHLGDSTPSAFHAMLNAARTAEPRKQGRNRAYSAAPADSAARGRGCERPSGTPE
jgi:hypothetical protein